ncbi:VCBS repeat-containing protein [Spongiimicrobium salis]|uniref:VCBS repeat-containing protein n=1 Tax=Spongiimicrobium salis TaxID=1667022 RepID=UPI00374DEB19
MIQTSKFNYPLFFTLWIILLMSCAESKKEEIPDKIQETLFTKIDPAAIGIDFENKIENEEDFNIFLYRNFYNGGGVAIGDINNDGLPDLYLTANRKKNKLYLNKGDFTFEDISETAGVLGTKAWSTGVVFVDINSDGFLDIYVCNAGNIEGDDQKNELFINNGDLTFTESAAQYNLADSGFTTHAAFFDYDKDGDLDVYMLNNSFISVASLGYNNKRDLRAKDWNMPEKVKGGGDKLLQNNNGVFTDVSEEANIYGSLIGFGLGVTIGDVNNDTYPDIYVSNDFFEHDYLYINNQDGTFKEDIRNWASHLSLFSMGADMADINNDGKSDIFVTDMLPKDDQRLKNTTTFETYDTYQRKLQNDFYHQYMQNTLQVNLGNSFSEIAHYSGVSSSDWSWGALLFDMDNDGYRDIYISNGVYHDLTNQDFIDFFDDVARQQSALTGTKDKKEAVINAMPSTPIVNYAFKNNQDLTFTDATAIWGFDEPSFSNGAAYGDMDNDGDLDLIVNTVNQELLVYKNNANTSANNFIKLSLKGERPNTFGVGSIVEAYMGDKILKQELIPSRGFQSSVEYTMTLGIGSHQKIDSLKVIWPNNKTQSIIEPAINTRLVLTQTDAKTTYVPKTKSRPTLLQEIKTPLSKHVEDKHIDFDYEGLISQMLSQEGPAMAVGDVNNDGHEDVFIGAAKGGIASLYLHQGKGSLKPSPTQDVFREDRLTEDTAAAFFDADGDGDLDLAVGSGGNVPDDSKAYKNRLYINDGKGNLTRSPEALKSTGHNVAVIAPYDFDQDGDIDLFIGSRSVPGIYGLNPKHLLLENDGKGVFSDVTESKAFALKDLGMVTSATWADINGDSKKDLVLVGDWMAPTVLRNNGRRLSIMDIGLSTATGWWNAVAAEDINGDGAIDLVLGNQGTNTTYITSEKAPTKMYINDFDDNGTIEQILTRNIEGRDVPIVLKRELTAQLVSLKKENLKFSDYATKSIGELLSPEVLGNAIVKTVSTAKSSIALNQGNGTFTLQELPKEAQFSCICDIACTDIDNDGQMDILFGGNNFEFKPQYGRLDASYGGLLLGNKDEAFQWQPYDISGFYMKGEIKHILPFSDKAGQLFFMVGRNNASPKVFSKTP